MVTVMVGVGVRGRVRVRDVKLVSCHVSFVLLY